MRRKFLVNDMVRVLKVHDENKAILDMVGKIVAYRPCNEHDCEHALYGVKFPKRFPRGHDLYSDGKSRCAEGCGWWLPAAKLELCG